MSADFSPGEKQLRALFSQCDSDRDGFLNIRDLQTVYHNLDLPMKTDEEIEVLFHLMDADKDNKISITEFIDTFNSMVNPSPPSVSPVKPRSSSDSSHSGHGESHLAPAGKKDRFDTHLPRPSNAGRREKEMGAEEPFENNMKKMEKLMAEAKQALSSSPESQYQHSLMKSRSEHDFSRGSLDHEAERQLEQLETQHQQLTERMKEIDEELYNTQQDNIRLKKRCFEANEEIFEANIKMDNYKVEAQTNKEIVDKQKKEIKQLTQEKEALAQKLSHDLVLLETEKVQWVQERKKYTTALKELDTQLKSLEQDMRKDQEDFVERIRVMEEEGRTKKNPDLERAMATIDFLEAQLHELQIHMNKGADKRHIEPLQAIINSLTVQVSELTEENNQLKGTVERTRGLLVDLEVKEGMFKSPSSQNVMAGLKNATVAQLQDNVRALMEENASLRDYLDRILAQIMMREDLFFLLKR